MFKLGRKYTINSIGYKMNVLFTGIVVEENEYQYIGMRNRTCSAGSCSDNHEGTYKEEEKNLRFAKFYINKFVIYVIYDGDINKIVKLEYPIILAEGMNFYKPETINIYQYYFDKVDGNSVMNVMEVSLNTPDLIDIKFIPE